MNRSRIVAALIAPAIAVVFAGCATYRALPGREVAEAQPLLLVHAHSHNDYEHARPLLDALDHGFCSVEADIHLVDGQLLVAHDQVQVKPDRTLQALYLDPLRRRVRENGGRVYRNGPPFMLLIDFKSDAEATYAALREILKQYADMLTAFGPGGIETNAVTVVISGNRPRRTMAAEPLRYCAMDGRTSDLDSDAPVHLIPLISDSWRDLFRWRGQGPLPDAERRKLRELVETIHARGCRARFWAAPDVPEAWRELSEAGVDLINTDDLAGLQQFLLSRAEE